jgi:aspartyl-tRNA(Asn)/glutamyl-tRNA(Gln) amidotransferase subunit A
LDPEPALLAGPSPRAFAPARGALITGEAARLHAVHEAETEAVRTQLRTGAGYTDAALEAARRELRALGTRLRAAVGDGVLVTPTISAPPPRWDEMDDVSDQIRATGRLTRLCGPVNTSGLVAMSLPFGADGMGHPLGVQIIAARESTLFAAALRLGGTG